MLLPRCNKVAECGHWRWHTEDFEPYIDEEPLQCWLFSSLTGSHCPQVCCSLTVSCPGGSFPGDVIMGDQGCVPGAATTSTTAEPGACLEYDVQSMGYLVTDSITDTAAACSQACVDTADCNHWRWHSADFVENNYGEGPRS